jgi:hypothetical protein
MSPRRPWLSFERAGGRPPRDDEALAVSEDGRFTARRTIGGRSIGAFEGTVPAAAMRRLRAAVDALAGPKEVEVPTPGHGATEVLAVAGRTLETGSNETPPKPWRPLMELVRKLLQDAVVDQPRAAVRLVAGPKAARLEHGGDTPIDVDLGTLEVRVVLMGADDAVRDRWSARLQPSGSGAAWATAGPGWSTDLPFDHGLGLAGGSWLQVWVDVAVREAGERRAGRLYVPVLVDD